MKAMVYKTLSTVVDDFFAYVTALGDVARITWGAHVATSTQVLHQDANSAQAGVLPRRRRVPRVFVSGVCASPFREDGSSCVWCVALDLPRRPEARERVWAGDELGCRCARCCQVEWDGFNDPRLYRRRRRIGEGAGEGVEEEAIVGS